jgi:hypothetical protein
MSPPSWVREQTRATRSLVKFLRDHDAEPNTDLTQCLAALEPSNATVAVLHAQRVKPHGMGGLTNWWPPVKFENEDPEYTTEVLYALVNNRCRLMSISFQSK